MTKKRIISLVLSVILVFSVLPMFSLNILAAGSTGSLEDDPTAGIQLGENVIPKISSDFEGATSISQTVWKSAAGVSTAGIKTESGNSFLSMTNIKNAYGSYGIDISKYITVADTYFISFSYRATGQGENVPFTAIIRTDKEYSFAAETKTNFYSSGMLAEADSDGVWKTMVYKFEVTEDDISSKTSSTYWNLCFHQINTGVTEIAIDNFKVRSRNIVPEVKSSYQTATSVSQTGWKTIYGGSTITNSLKQENGNKYFSFTKQNDGSGKYSWYTAGTDIVPYINLPDTYVISFDYRTDGALNQRPFSIAIRCDKAYSFTNSGESGTYYYSNESVANKTDDEWQTMTFSIDVSQEDINNRTSSSFWNLCFHLIPNDVSRIDIDNLKIVSASSDMSKIIATQTWLANEAVFVSSKSYSDPYNDVTVDLVLNNATDGTTLTVPCFWDGGKVWRARFACPTAGTWTYTTVCSDTTNTGLHGQTSIFPCSLYSGDLDIYKKGFVKTVSGTKYFKYNNNDAFFYLGDTHWSLGDETVEMVHTIAAQRKNQGYTVIQSEPIGAKFRFVDGITQADMAGFAVNDQKFKIIADNGLVHANSEFFFPSEMRQFILNNGGWSTTKVVGQTAASDGSQNVYDMTDSAKAALRTAARYWVARYGAYPVMWTLGQEVDNDFYWERGEHSEWNYVNNPYVYVAECIKEFDAYAHPLTAHQEGVSRTNLSGVTSSLTDGDKSKESAFINCSAHTWYAAQWSQSYDKQINFVFAEDFWKNNSTKPVVNYEGKYCYLWTKDFGARVQGWMSYLCGMYGCSFGGQDTWSYGNTYNEKETSRDGVDIITPDDKQLATWQDSLQYRSSYQLGYMRNFMENIVGNWYDLVPRFANKVSGKSYQYFAPKNSSVFYVCASTDDGSKAVVYLYNFSNPELAKIPNATEANAKLTGTLAGLSKYTNYNYVWYNPVTGQIDSTGTIKSDYYGKITVPNKADTDMVFYVCKANASCAHTNKTDVEATAKTCSTRGYSAYTICRDCLKVVSGTAPSADASPLAAHTSTGSATCGDEEKCSVCNMVLASRLGHEYNSVVTASTCETAGRIDYTCKRDGCNNTKYTELAALGHADFEAAKYTMPSGGQYYWITQYGSGSITPFKGIQMTGDSCTVKFYVYNDTTKKLTNVALAYNWGYHSYASETSTSKEITGTAVSCSIAPGTSGFVELTVPKSAIISNKVGYATDNSSDSIGEAVDCTNMGIRFTFEHKSGVKDATGTIYVSCVGASENVTNWQSITQFLQQSGTLTGDATLTAANGISSLPDAVGTKIKTDYINNGFITTSIEGKTFDSNGYIATHCIRCDEIVDRQEIGGVVDNSTTVKFSSSIDNASVSYSDGKAGKNIIATVSGVNETLTAGQVYTLTANAVAGQKFAGWYRESGSKKILLSKDETVEVLVNFDDELFAYYVDASSDCTVTFKDNYGNVIYTCAMSEITETSVPAVSAFDGAQFLGWKLNGTTYNDNAQLVAAIKSANAEVTVSQMFKTVGTFKVYVNGSVKGNYSADVPCLTIATVEAPETNGAKQFSYWQGTDKDGNTYIASYDKKFSFYVTSGTTLTAVYGEEANKALITVTEVSVSDGKAVATIQRSVTRDCTVIEQGVILTKDDKATDEQMILGATDNIIVVRSTGNANNGVLIVTKLNVADGDNYRFRGYVIYRDSEGNVFTKYSAVK